MSARKPWADRIDAAKVRGRFTPYEKRLAMNFHTCAVGEVYIPADRKSDHWMALDYVRNGRSSERLLDLGGSFALAVATDNVIGAKELLREIRSATRARLKAAR